MIDIGCRTTRIPPASFIPGRTVVIEAAEALIIVEVSSTELPVAGPARIEQRITGIPAVPGHCQSRLSAVSGHIQLVLTILFSDGERGVFSRVPQTRGALDLRITTTSRLKQVLMNQELRPADHNLRSIYA